MSCFASIVLSGFAATAVFLAQPQTARAQAQLAGFDASGQPGGSGNFGASPLAASVASPGLTVGGLTRGAGVGQSGTGAAKGFGGTGFNYTTAALADAANAYFTFNITVNPGSVLSLSSIDTFSYRRSGTGPASALIEYQVGTGAFNPIITESLTSTSSSGTTFSNINLAGFSDLQSALEGTSLTFRITPFGASGTGPFYFYDVAGSTAADLSLSGTVPEPTTVLGGVLLIGAAGWSQRRRLRGLLIAAS